MRLSCLLITLFFVALRLEGTMVWQTDYAQVLSLSQKENKPILLFFNGSDWVGAAMKMKHEILNTKAFEEKIASRFICMEVDFPKHTPMNDALMDQNLDLKNRFKVQDFPSLLLLDCQQRVIAQIAYLPENTEQLARDLLKLVEQDAELLSGLQQLSTSSEAQLKKLYQLAQELGSESSIEEILAAGLKTNDPYFLVERYRFLVEKGEMKSQEAKVLRQKLLRGFDANESVNGQAVSFTVALIDFQELSQKNHDPEIAVQPLLEYLNLFGKSDATNIWRVEMMIAEVYLDADRWEEAFKHAERAFQSAPESMHGEIAHSLDYIRAQTSVR